MVASTIDFSLARSIFADTYWIFGGPCYDRISLDAKYDELHNYEFARQQDAVPPIDYNPRNEKPTREAVIEQGYDRNGWPLWVPVMLFHVAAGRFP